MLRLGVSIFRFVLLSHVYFESVVWDWVNLACCVISYSIVFFFYFVLFLDIFFTLDGKVIVFGLRFFICLYFLLSSLQEF